MFPVNAEKIIIADDHPLFRSAIRQALQSELEACEILECDSSDSLKSILQSHADAELLILDLSMPGVDGFSSLAYVKKHYPELPAIIISANDKPETVMLARHFGSLGFVSKSSSIEEIRNGIVTVLSGDFYFSEELDESQFKEFTDSIEKVTYQVAELTPQQHKVLGMMKQGLLNKQIAYDLNISEATVKAHVTAIMRKLEVNNRTQAVMKVAELNLDSLS